MAAGKVACVTNVMLRRVSKVRASTSSRVPCAVVAVDRFAVPCDCLAVAPASRRRSESAILTRFVRRSHTSRVRGCALSTRFQMAPGAYLRAFTSVHSHICAGEEGHSRITGHLLSVHALCMCMSLQASTAAAGIKRAYELYDGGGPHWIDEKAREYGVGRGGS